MKRLLIPLMLLIAAPAHAFTPETGWWWNPEESGRGFTIEVQDNTLFIATYVYQDAGQPVWYVASGKLWGYGGSDPEPYVRARLQRFENGQCLGCPYQGRPDEDEDFAEPIRIDFTSRTSGEITWNDGSTTPIRRHNFALGNENEKMLGEWRMVIDFSPVAEDGFAFWSGDALVFDQVDTDEQGPFLDGYRRFSRFHHSGDTDDPGNAAGEFTDGSGGGPGSYTIVVHNSTDPDEWWLAYYLEVGIDSFDGVAEVYCEDDSDPECKPTGEGVPVRGWRSASRKYVVDGTGPHGKSAPSGMAALPGDAGGAGGIPVPDRMRVPAGKAAASVEKLSGDPVAAEAAVRAARRLTDQLRARTASGK